MKSEGCHFVLFSSLTQNQTTRPPLPHHLLWEGGYNNLQSQILRRGDQDKKVSAWVVLKSPCHRYFPEGLTMFLVKKDFEGSLFKCHLGLGLF